MIRSKKSGRRVWKRQGLQVTQCYKQRLCWSYIVRTHSPWHQKPSSHESRFHILPIFLVGNPLVEHFLLFKRIFQSLSAQLMNMHHIPPKPQLLTSASPFNSKLLGLFLNLGVNAASAFVFNRLYS